MPHYFQCSKCKILKTVDDIKFETTVINQDGGGTVDITDIKPENLSEIVCHSRRMRQLTQNQFDHETIQREHVENSGPAPVNTALMNNNYAP